MPHKCGRCPRNVTPKAHPGISCVLCKSYFHFDCVNISKDKAENISQNKLSWTCSKCSSRRSTIIPGDTDNVAQGSSFGTVPTSNSIESTLRDLVASIENFKTSILIRLDNLEKQGATKVQEVSELKDSVRIIETKSNEIEKLSLEKSVEVQGIPEEILEQPIEAAKLIGREINCEINLQEIDCKVTRTGEKQNLLINFNSISVRDRFLELGKRFNREKKKITHNNRQHKIFVNEKLTSDQKRLLYNTKLFARQKGYQFAWICHGKVHLKLSIDSQPIIILSEQQLTSLNNNNNELTDLLPEREGVAIENQRNVSSNRL